jgi:hypothetical protein
MPIAVRSPFASAENATLGSLAMEPATIASAMPATKGQPDPSRPARRAQQADAGDGRSDENPEARPAGRRR